MASNGIGKMLAALVDLVLAPVCLGCDRPIAAGDAARLVCRRCRSRLRAPPSPRCPRCDAPRLRTGRTPGRTCTECSDWPPWVRVARSACSLRDPADRLVHQLKYRGWQALAGPIAERMAMVSLPEDVVREAQIVVPVPTTPTRLRERGYNQAERIARAFARRTGRTVREPLHRRVGSPSQTTLQPSARGANVAGAFGVEREREVRGRHLLVVDDVFTTGATAIECARTLVAAGARCASVITFARTPPTRKHDTATRS